MYGPIGYYVTCDDAVCADCAPDGFADGDYGAWPGFESWEEPLPIFADSESDTPTHCVECRSLIPRALTYDGYEYVRGAILSHPGVVVCQYDQGLRTGDDMNRVACLEMAGFVALDLDHEDNDLIDGSGWCEDPDDSEALQDFVRRYEDRLPDGIVSVWNGDAGTWSILDLRPQTLGDVLSAWNDEYPDWLN